ncbi:hypothetical protein AC629_24200 [Bradyrhizobium sp. NAS80.1]|uniref:c-type cytochrome n=1 Tax=Bradyrhizobium sp. NAS80.1 TaxID=1680159 RepID=UPI0009664137|nr:c-type cytochrome [Bradyrhizobium sp. NAS80.1]OKO82288.1 hypothetical protein AC629_24200 [Bradyrhizobium sp. NAS80.1]
MNEAREEALFSLANRWFVGSVTFTAALAIVSALVGLIILPRLQSDVVDLKGLWDSICSAAGVAARPSSETPVEATFVTSTVQLNPGRFAHPSAESIARGKAIARTCAACHGGVDGTRAKFPSPNLAGQPAGAIFKQLRDYQTGARVSVVMRQYVQALSEQDALDLSAYYAQARREAEPVRLGMREPPIVAIGSPTRNVPACGSCHGSGDLKIGTPWLDGQPVVYLRAQLAAYASGRRTNDIDKQMRNIARNMSSAEIDEAARYYASRP